MIDILSDSVQKIFFQKTSEAYGGREVVDGYDPPVQLMLKRVQGGKSDGHIELAGENDPDILSFSDANNIGVVTQKGLSMSSHTRSPFVYPNGFPPVAGVFGTALRGFGKVVCILRANMVDEKEYVDWFCNEWGVTDGDLLESVVPTMKNPGKLGFAGMLENRNPAIFAHPNNPGLNRFTWHGVTNEELSKRVGSKVSMNFAKARCLGEWHTRMLTCESSLTDIKHGPARIFYAINTEEIPDLITKLVMPRVTRRSPPTGTMARAVLTCEHTMAVHREKFARRIQEKIADVGTISGEINCYGAMSEMKNLVPTIAPKVRLDPGFYARAAKVKDDAEIITFEEATRRPTRRLFQNVVKPTRGELHHILNPVLPKDLLPAANDRLWQTDNKFVLRQFFYKLGEVNLVQNLWDLGRVVYRNKTLCEDFHRHACRSLGILPSDYHHKKGTLIWKHALSRSETRTNVLPILRKVAYLRYQQMAKIQYTCHIFWQLWAQKQSYSLAVAEMVRHTRKAWSSLYAARAANAEVKKAKIHYQQMSLIVPTYKIHFDIEGKTSGSYDMKTLSPKLSTTLYNFHRKRSSDKKFQDPAFRIKYINESTSKIHTLDFVESYDNFVALMDEVASQTELGTQTLGKSSMPSIGSKEIVRHALRVAEEITGDVKGVLDDAARSFKERSVGTLEDFNEIYYENLTAARVDTKFMLLKTPPEWDEEQTQEKEVKQPEKSKPIIFGKKSFLSEETYDSEPEELPENWQDVLKMLLSDGAPKSKASKLVEKYSNKYKFSLDWWDALTDEAISRGLVR